MKPDVMMDRPVTPWQFHLSPVMTPEGSITLLLKRLKNGESAASQKLWEIYFQQLVRLARRKLQNAQRRVADEEDVALSAFKSFCLGVERGRFPQLSDRESLWPLLVAITAHKSIDLIRHENRQIRGGDLEVLSGEAGAVELERILSREPTPEFAEQLGDQFDHLIQILGDDQLRRIALWRMEGYAIDEIAERLDCSPRTVKRKLQRIRTIWNEARRDEPED